jgi:hypothetical protein
MDAGELPGTGGRGQQDDAAGQHLDGSGQHRVAGHGEPVAQD